MSNNLLILGAGVDRTQGIDFPLANTLLADVSRYLEGPGKPVDEALRAMLPGLRFSFNNMIARAVDKIATRETHEQKAMVQRVREAIVDLPPEQDSIRKHGELIIRLFEKLATIAEQSYLDKETEALIREVFPKDADDLIDSDSILDIHKLSLSDTFKTVLKRTLKMGLSGEHHAVATALGADMLNIETLLVEKFLGFYNEKPADIKNYLYISWALWAYLVAKQREVLISHGDVKLPFYGKIPNTIRALTLNYTAFLQSHLGDDQVIYFHGGLAEYVRMDTRDLLPVENILECDPADFIRTIIAPNVDVTHEDVRQQRHVIPALVPPLRLKPILSHKYIELWSKASHWVSEAQHIVVVGYSFNNADEHFNDILRCHPGRKIDIVVPEAHSEYFKRRMEAVLNIPASQFNTVKINGHLALQARNVRLIAARASDVNIPSLFGLE
ncbi:hypothetical protein [Zobellella sp. An-6]|uniref:hypothetical protein n=1 Tax=Zobellella sp. An-6 TaxID=3400218 RepID=UPI004041939B